MPTTYALWAEVYNWATAPERESNIYSFDNPGGRGGYSSGSYVSGHENHPVSYVNWYDTIT